MQRDNLGKIAKKSIENQSKLYFAGNKDIVNLLIENGADINAKDPSNATALSLAIFKNSEKVVRTLVEMGIDVNIEDSSPTPHLIKAISNGKELRL